MKTKLHYSLWAVFFLSFTSIFGQNLTCGNTFTDPAGANANYANNSDYIVTIYPTNPGDMVTVTFTSFNTETNWDALYVFNGNSINAPQIASTNGAANVPGGLAGGYWGATIPGPFTSSSPDGSLTFRFRSDTVVNNPGWIANITCSPPSTCITPTQLTASNITETSLSFSWGENNSANLWEWIAVPSGSPAPTNSDSGSITEVNPAAITGLNSNTCYNLYVRSVCSSADLSNWSTPITACTLIPQPVCGGTFVDNGGSTANYANSSNNIYTICPNNPGDLVTVSFSAFSTEATWDALYVFDGNSVASPMLASTNPAGNVPGGLAGGYWGTIIPGPFTSSSTDGCLTFRFRSDTAITSSGWIGNVSCAPAPTCPKPTALTSSNISTTTATLGWTNTAATQWEYTIVPAGSPAPGLATLGTLTTVNPVVITGLSANTCYTFYVRAHCDANDTSEWSLPYNFCSAVEPPACGGLFVDNGGSSANYANSADNTYTICPQIAGEAVTVVFSSFNTESTWDALYVFDGNSIAAPQIASSNAAANVPGGLAGGYWGTTIPGPFTSSSPDGCLTFRFRSDTSVNNPGWIANVICAPELDKILLVAYVDLNNDGAKDANEPLFSNGSFIYQQNNDGINVNAYSPTGRYSLYDNNPTNSYDFNYIVQAEFASYFNAGTTSYNDITIATGSGTQLLYFPIAAIQDCSDVIVSIVPISPPRPTLNYSNRIVYKNQGLNTANGTLTFAKPSQVTIATVSQTGVTNNVNGFSYNFTNLLPNETRYIDVTMTVPATPTVNLNDVLTDTATISGVTGDVNSANNATTNSQIVVNSFDPNNKMESHGNKIPFNQFNQNDYFHYTIRFQNNGTASAIDVRIEDFLDAKIDEESILMESSSHSYSMTRVGNHLVWTFKNIYLPSSTIDAIASTGFVEFKVKLKPGFQTGDIIPNNASIYFDSNAAIVTNTFNVKFIQPLSTVTFNERSLIIYPNPASTLVQLTVQNSSERISKVTFYDILGKIIKTFTPTSSDSVSIDVTNLAKGIYLMELTSDLNSKITKKLIIE
jgi:hypothetical protein